jgi:hypothetical protein
MPRCAAVAVSWTVGLLLPIFGAMDKTLECSASLITRLKDEIARSANNPDFIHHTWYLKYHLELVERIANELLGVYPSADRELVLVLVWIHDYGKMITTFEDRKATLVHGRHMLLEIGFGAAFVDRVIEYVDIMDSNATVDLEKSPIEVKIVSSADGCSHLVGPFFQLWFWENPARPFEELMDGNLHKAKAAWERKIVLPEAREAFRVRNQVIMELNGTLPKRFITDLAT